MKSKVYKLEEEVFVLRDMLKSATSQVKQKDLEMLSMKKKLNGGGLNI